MSHCLLSSLSRCLLSSLSRHLLSCLSRRLLYCPSHCALQYCLVIEWSDTQEYMGVLSVVILVRMSGCNHVQTDLCSIVFRSSLCASVAIVVYHVFYHCDLLHYTVFVCFTVKLTGCLWANFR